MLYIFEVVWESRLYLLLWLNLLWLKLCLFTDTWNARGGAAAAAILARAEAERRGKGRRGDQVYHTVTGAVSTAHTKPSHPPSIFEVFRPRSKSDAATKKPNFIGHMKNAMSVSQLRLFWNFRVFKARTKKNFHRKLQPAFNGPFVCQSLEYKILVVI